MVKPAARRQETFPARVFRLSKKRIGERFSRVNAWRRKATASVGDFSRGAADWMLDRKIVLVIILSVVGFVGLTVSLIVDLARGRVEGSALQVFVAGVIGGAIAGLIASLIAGVVAFLVLLFLNWSSKLLMALLLFLPLILWAPVYASWRAALVFAQLLFLIPLFVLFVLTRLIQVWRGIFYTCPAHQCAYRGFPVHVCPNCGQANEKLWPNLYGLLWHNCVKCDRRLPALGLMGRSRLRRQCGDRRCRIPLPGKHAGKAPERLVGIVGVPASGKTNYLLMAAKQIIEACRNSKGRVRGGIADVNQQPGVARELRRLGSGLPARKTPEDSRALVMHVKLGRSRCLLYLYDVRGEELLSISGMTGQQYFRLLEGFVLLVDPLNFESVGAGTRSAQPRASPAAFQDVVDATLMKAISEMDKGRHGKVPKRVAVVISKADLPAVREQVGDITRGRIPAETCRHAVASWGGENALRGIEHHFQHVEYFACSALGRDPTVPGDEPFEGAGVLEPLVWLLTGNRSKS